MRIKLIANGLRPWERWIRRWGLSILIDDNILFDTFGDARVLMRNLRQFKVDIDKIKEVVVSHEHWDHVDGVRPLLVQNPGLKVYLPYHADPALKDKVRAWGGNVVVVSKPVKLKDTVHVSGEIIGRYADKNMPEQAMVLQTDKGLVIVAGCAHPGIVTIVDRVKNDFKSLVYGVAGGFHLKEHSLENISTVVDELKAAGVGMVVPLHCTGVRAERILKQVFGASCLILQEGQEITL